MSIICHAHIPNISPDQWPIHKCKTAEICLKPCNVKHKYFEEKLKNAVNNMIIYKLQNLAELNAEFFHQTQIWQIWRAAKFHMPCVKCQGDMEISTLLVLRSKYPGRIMWIQPLIPYGYLYHHNYKVITAFVGIMSNKCVLAFYVKGFLLPSRYQESMKNVNLFTNSQNN